MNNENKSFEAETIEEIVPANQKTIFSITEAARKYNRTRQAVYVAIKQKKMKATKIDGKWGIHVDDLEEYENNKYSREKSTYDGELLFDNDKGFFSINQTAKLLNVPAQKIYYATRIGQLPASRKGSAWVINIEDIKIYKEKFVNKTSAFEMQNS